MSLPHAGPDFDYVRKICIFAKINDYGNGENNNESDRAGIRECICKKQGGTPEKAVESGGVALETPQRNR
jgi:hypothetical protein